MTLKKHLPQLSFKMFLKSDFNGFFSSVYTREGEKKQKKSKKKKSTELKENVHYLLSMNFLVHYLGFSVQCPFKLYNKYKFKNKFHVRLAIIPS